MKITSLLYKAVFFVPCFLSLASGNISAQDIRSFDGYGNNVANPTLGAAHESVLLIVPPAYSDSISAPAGIFRPGPREISNTIFAQSGLINNELTLSDYVWVFGQFIDHDLVLSENDVTEPILIPVPEGDEYMDPFGTGTAVIPMFRNQYDPSTGTSPDNPRQHINSITSFLDGSTVYGSDDARASWLRTFEGGKLKTSEGNLLPFDTRTGEFNDPRDPQAPFMANDVGSGTKLFVAGDIRANENPLLLAFHTLFVREHNRLCDQYQKLHPSWDDERMYQKARSTVTGLIQSVVYNEWLPSMGVHLPDYEGYDPGIDPRVSNVFATAAFRMGHTLLNGQLMRLDNEGNVIPYGNLSLRDAFFNPKEVLFAGGIEPYIKGMGVQIQQDLDCKVIDDVRNFLFGEPGQGGLDLASINIMRGRERGLPGFNEVREAFGLNGYDDFEDICGNEEVTGHFHDMYVIVEDLDPWVGMLAEDHMPSALFGETIMTIMLDQFRRLRDGDRFYYENDPGLPQSDKEEISNTRLSDIIRRNTNIVLMQDNVFYAMEHDDIPFARSQVTRRNLDVAIFPNPVVDALNVKSYVTLTGQTVLRIFDSNGRLVFEQEREFTSGINTMTLDFAGQLTPGTYVLQLEKEGAYNSVKFIKL